MQLASTRAVHSDTDGIIDSGVHFTIDPITKQIVNNGKKVIVPLGSHNSERISFDCPRYLDGHDVLNCNKITISYGIDGLYEVDDAALNADDNTKVTFSWLITCNASVELGILPFAISMDCVQENGDITYSFPTVTNKKDIEVVETLRHSDKVAIENVDVLERWKNDLFGSITMPVVEDSATGQQYQLYVSGGKLMMKEVV